MALMVRPWAYSGPQWMAAQPPSCNLRCHFWRRCWLASPERLASSPRDSASRNGGRCSSSQARSSSRNVSSSGARAKSTQGRVPDPPCTVTLASGNGGARCARASDTRIGEAVDFTYDEEQLALQEV